jgi:septum site-determining protein MinD
MSRIIVVTSGKGGVGKTTTTSNLGAAIAKQNRSVALIDADFGLRNLDLLLGLEESCLYSDRCSSWRVSSGTSFGKR